MRKIHFPIVFILLLVVCPLISRSCANTTTPPSGGPKDTIPPVLLETVPGLNSIHHPRDIKKSEVTFIFDEYVVLKEPMKNIFLSPPLSKPPLSKIKGKKVVISFQDLLDSATTYSLDLGAAVVDNNEGIPFPKYVYSFSTGDVIDSLYVSGSVVNATTMLPTENITILFHTDPSDSAIFNILPKAAAKSDVWGYFTVRNLAPGSYRVFAIQDINNNNKFEPENEMVAFLDSLLVPDKVMHPDIPELAIVDVKDTATCLSRPSQIQMYLFKEVSSRMLLKNKGRPVQRMVYITFSAPYPQIDSLVIDGYPDDKIIKEFNQTRDSLALWINDQGDLPDTLKLAVKYMKTDDSLKILVPETETHKFAAPKPKLTRDQRGNAVEVKDTVAKYSVTVSPENVEQDGYLLEFETPIITAPLDSIKLKCITNKQQIKYEEITIEPDSTNIRKFTIRPKNKMILGYEYILKIPHRLFIDINGLPCDSLEKKVTLPNDDNLSSIKMELENVNGNYIVELVNEKRDKTLRMFRIDHDCTLLFPYLKKGKYSVRITEDKNGNGLIDTGSVLEKRQPEKVLLYKFGDSLGSDAFLLDVPERFDLEQSIDIGVMFQ